MTFFTETSHSLLCHPHEWVRLSATKFLGFVLTSVTHAQFTAALNGQSSSASPLLDASSVHHRVKSLVLDHCAQFIPGTEIAPEFVDQVCQKCISLSQVCKPSLPELNYLCLILGHQKFSVLRSGSGRRRVKENRRGRPRCRRIKGGVGKGRPRM